MTNFKELDLWFSMGSTYTYLTMMRLPEIQQKHNVQFRLHPFNLGKFFKEAGFWPFKEETPKMAYMWRDIERKAAQYGLPANLPAPYPAPNALLANKICFVANQEGWGLDLARECYKRWFVHGEIMGGDENLDQAITSLGRDKAKVLELASSESIDKALDAETEVARELGIFGSPTFVVGKEIFWGNDRVEDAVAWEM